MKSTQTALIAGIIIINLLIQENLAVKGCSSKNEEIMSTFDTEMMDGPELYRCNQDNDTKYVAKQCMGFIPTICWCVDEDTGEKTDDESCLSK